MPLVWSVLVCQQCGMARLGIHPILYVSTGSIGLSALAAWAACACLARLPTGKFEFSIRPITGSDLQNFKFNGLKANICILKQQICLQANVLTD